jgi:hypothetical protein
MSSRSLADANPTLASAFLRAKEAYEAAHPGNVIEIICTARTPEEQWELFKVGRKQINGFWLPDPDSKREIVTKVDGKQKKSMHNYTPSRAIDFCIIVKGKTVWADIWYDEAGPFFEHEGLVWGGNFPHAPDFKDRDHVELPL